MKTYKNQKFNRWTILSDTKNKKVTALCDCGSIKEINIYDIKRELSKSCGCYRRDTVSKRAKTHGKTKTRVYSSWTAMKRRCNTPGYNCYYLYGGRGITYDPRWEKFENFLEDMGEPSHMQSLDRIDNEKNYSKDNCRWATAKEQANNRRRASHVRQFDFNGQKVTIRDLITLCPRAKYGTLYGRVYRYKGDINKAIKPYI